MEIPKEIVKRIKNTQCILFLGARASADSPDDSPFDYKVALPSGSELSERLAEKCSYPYSDKTDLQRVSLYYQFRPGGSRSGLVQAIKEEMPGPEIEPSPALRMLAALPFPMVITTDYDRLFDVALGDAYSRTRVRKRPQVRIYNPKLNAQPDHIPLSLTEENPILLKLHGDVDRPESIVLMECGCQPRSDDSFRPSRWNQRCRL